VFAPVGATGLGRKGSGYLIADGLVLTARHVVEGATDPCEIRPLDTSDWTSATTIWPAGSADVALLALPSRDATPAELPCASLGRFDTTARAPCEAAGFPRAQLGLRDGSPVRRIERISGEVDPLTGREPGREQELLTVHVGGSTPLPDADATSPWEGMSGAALFSAGLLIGVIIADPSRFGADRLLAVPIARALVAFPTRGSPWTRCRPVVFSVEDVARTSDVLEDRCRQFSLRASCSARDLELSRFVGGSKNYPRRGLGARAERESARF
jgi:hypothetical protein